MLSYSVVVVLGEYQFYWNRHIRDIPLDAIGGSYLVMGKW